MEHMIRKTSLRKWCIAAVVCAGAAASTVVSVPQVWRDVDLANFRTPLAGLGHPPKVVSEADYYSLPEANVKTYPVYAPGKEPAGYIEWLKQQDPKPMVDPAQLKTEADWVAAGKEVFEGRELPRFSGSEDNLAIIHDPRIVAAYRLQTSPDGILIGLRYVVKQKGKVELGTDTCAMCHTQVRDGRLIEGPPNIHTPFGPLMGDLTKRYASFGPDFLEERRRKHMREDYRVPYLVNDPNIAVADLPADQIAELYDRNPLGTHARTNTSLLYPVKISNLINIKDFQYFDHTGTARQRSITDLMRYAGSIADVTDALTQFGDGPEAHLKLANMGLGSGIHRTPDASLYALALYIYSLKAPANPNPFGDSARAGEKVFKREQCAQCHTPPFYTSNKLTIAKGYEPTETQRHELDIINVSVGTDPGLALKTRKGTGFYRVPSLRNVWMDACFLHDGSIGSLDEMFNPDRMKPDFRSSNWSTGTPSHAVEGHPFGLTLKPEERTDLVAFLKTL